jgi:hypothetical protein
MQVVECRTHRAIADGLELHDGDVALAGTVLRGSKG